MYDPNIHKRREVVSLGIKHGYQVIEMSEGQIKQGLVSLTKNFKDHGLVRINYYLTTRRMSITLDHPKKGRNQQYKSYTDLNTLGQILQNPRVHTTGGYRERKEGRRTNYTKVKKKR